MTVFTLLQKKKISWVIISWYFYKSVDWDGKQSLDQHHTEIYFENLKETYAVFWCDSQRKDMSKWHYMIIFFQFTEISHA